MTKRNEGGEPLASRVTARSQTTLPTGVRKALGLRAGDRIAYTIQGDEAVIRRLAEEEDPVLTGFLDLLERDVAAHGERVVFATRAFHDHLAALTGGVEADHDAPIEGDFEL